MEAKAGCRGAKKAQQNLFHTHKNNHRVYVQSPESNSPHGIRNWLLTFSHSYRTADKVESKRLQAKMADEMLLVGCHQMRREANHN